MQAQERGLDRDGQVARQRTSDLQHAPLGGEVETIARLHLEGGDALGHEAPRPHSRGRGQGVEIRLPGRIDGGLNAAAGTRDLLIGHAAKPLLELRDPIAAVDQVSMAIDEARRHPQTFGLLDGDPAGSCTSARLFAGTDPGNTLAFTASAPSVSLP